MPPDRHEKLQLGRAKGRPAMRRRRTDESRWHYAREKWKRRRAAKKRRLARMSRPKRVLRRLGVIGTWLLALITLMMVTAVALFYTLSDVPKPESLPLPQVATILYADGSTMARIGTVNRTIVPLAQVPEHVRWAVLAAEDRGFYNNPGVSIKGTLRAALSDITGGDTQGGSGITQQYAKNAYLSDARTLTRKLKELMISVKLSREYSKDQILEWYLNTVYFGRGAYGIEAASVAYFHTDVSKLDVAQGAVLAALLRAPSYYDPAANPAEAKARWHYVVDGMVSIKRLTQQKADALTYPKVDPPKSSQLGVDGPKALIVHQVLRELAQNGISEAEVYQRGLKITTTISPKAQAAAENAINTTFANLTPQQKNMKNALVAVNPTTGGVIAYYGGPNGPGYDGKVDRFDYAGLGWRPPGSSFKPYTLATVLDQTLKKTPGKPRLTVDSIVNGSYCVDIQSRKICNDPSDQWLSSPSVSLRNAMKWSLNTTFDLMAVQVGPNNVAELAHKAGIPQTDSYGNPTLTNGDGQTGFNIGIGGYPVRPIDQAVGFATFANGGIHNPPYFVQKAVASGGGTVYTHEKDYTRAMDPKVAHDVTLTLEPIAGWSRASLADGRASAAKTGTEGIPDDPNGSNSDAWMVGFTPQVSSAVWVGSGTSTDPVVNAGGLPEYGSDLPAKTWKLFMDTYLSGQPKLPMPGGPPEVTDGRYVPPPPPSTAKAAPSTSTASSASSSPTPTFTVSTGFSSPTPSPTAPTTPTTSTAQPPPVVHCQPVLPVGQTCTTTTPTPAPPP